MPTFLAVSLPLVDLARVPVCPSSANVPGLDALVSEDDIRPPALMGTSSTAASSCTVPRPALPGLDEQLVGLTGGLSENVGPGDGSIGDIPLNEPLA